MKIKYLATALIVIMAFSVMAAGCPPPPTHVVKYAYTTSLWWSDLSMPIDADSSLNPSAIPGVPEVCKPIRSDVEHRTDYCRFIYGAEEFGDNRTWELTFTADGKPGGGPFSINCDPYHIYGCALVVEDGTHYEGCVAIVSVNENSYACDYRAKRPFMMSNNVDHGLGFYPDKLWNWTKYEANAAKSCALAFAAVASRRNILTVTALIGCVDTPYEGG